MIQELFIKDDITYYDFIYWLSSRAMGKSVGVVGKKDLLIYFTEELLNLDHLCLSVNSSLFDDQDNYFLWLNMEQGIIEILPFDKRNEIPNIVCLMEDCMEFLPEFHKWDDDDIYICRFEEEK